MTEWMESVNGLADQVQEWVPLFHKAKGEGDLQAAASRDSEDYPLLEMETANGVLIRLEPAYFAYDRIPTVVNLYVYPTLRRVRLVGPIGGAWEVQSSEGVAMNYQWNKRDFTHLLVELASESVSGRV